MSVFTPFTLGSGLSLKNRLVKAAMEENLANTEQLPDKHIYNLYDAWAKGGVGMIITGNVMIDPLAMTGPAGIALHNSDNLAAFRKWADIAKANDTAVIMQINHPGRQVYKSMHGKVLSPSDVALDLGKHSGMFSQPKAMTQEQIEDVIARFTASAVLAEKAGFNGVQIHAAHGYLLSQFLSPLVNKRNDEWGGDRMKRAKLLITIVDSVKQSVSNSFSVSVKLNSADFQRGGFDVVDAVELCKTLDSKALDFIELSGGSYEAPAMQGRSGDERTLAREAYFIEFAKTIAEQSNTPIMTTGGIKRVAVANQVLSNGVDLVGIASALAYQPNLPVKWQQDQTASVDIPSVNWGNKAFASLATMALVRRQLQRLGRGKQPSATLSPLWSLISDQIRLMRLTKRYRRNIVKA